MPEIELKELSECELGMILDAVALDQPGLIGPLRGHIAWLKQRNLPKNLALRPLDDVGLATIRKTLADDCSLGLETTRSLLACVEWWRQAHANQDAAIHKLNQEIRELRGIVRSLETQQATKENAHA